MKDPPVGTALRGYAAAPLLVAASTIAGLLIEPRWGTSAVDLLFLPAVIATAVLFGLGPALVAAIAAALTYNFFFTAPYRTFLIHSPADVLTVVVLFLVAMVTSQLAASVRHQAQLAAGQADRNAAIAGFARQLLGCAGESEIAAVATAEMARLFEANTVLLANRAEPHPIASSSPVHVLNPSDLAVAALVAASGKPAGRGITPAMAVEWQFYPVGGGARTLAILGIARDDGLPAVRDDRRSLLDSLLDQTALALERARLDGEARDFAALRERDQVRTSLLSSVGKDLAPAIAAIGTAADALRRTGEGDRESLATLSGEAARLKRYIANLSDLAPAGDQPPVEAGGVSIDLFRRTVSRDGDPVHLTPKEYAVLAELAKHPGRVLSHAHLLRSAWGPAQEKQAEYLRVAVRGLRQKLEADPKHPQLILNEPAVGYRLAI